MFYYKKFFFKRNYSKILFKSHFGISFGKFKKLYDNFVPAYISVVTVKTHIINIYAKLGISNRIQAIKEGRKINSILK